jgi:carbon monoxide dehydrogenase subunit G
MEMTGEQIIPLPQQRVWEALNDPDVLKACIPGCESIVKVSDDEYAVAMVAAVGPVKAKFSGKLRLADLNPPNSYSIAFEGSGGAAGFGKGSAQVSLVPEGGNSTKLQYTANANVGGRLAQVGSRLIDGVARKMADDFFTRFNQTVATAEIAEQQEAPALTDPEASPSNVKYPSMPGWVWAAAAAVVAALIYFSMRGH